MDDNQLSYYWASWQDPGLDAVNAAVQFFDDEGLSGATFKDLRPAFVRSDHSDPQKPHYERHDI